MFDWLIDLLVLTSIWYIHKITIYVFKVFAQISVFTQFEKKLQWCPGRSSKAGAEIGWSPDIKCRGVKTKTLQEW